MKPPRIAMIAAMAKNRVIGNDNKMPWHLPADLGHFKKTTLHKPVIMGRKTYQSIGFPLPGRKNIIVSRQVDFQPQGVSVVSDLRQAIHAAGEVEELIIMGGATIYQQMLQRADRLYLTFIELEIEGDTFFPDYEQFNWQETYRQSHLANDKNPYNYVFITLDRVWA